MEVESATRDEMARRERQFARSNDPAALWPGIAPRDIQRSADDIGLAVTAMLRGGHASLHRTAGIEALGIAGLLTGTGPLLGHWIEAGTLDAADDVARLFAAHLAQGRARFARIHAEAGPALRGLERAGIRPAVMKGYHTAQRYFPEPGVRPFADIDVIVDPVDVARAETVLRDAGFVGGKESRSRYKREWHPPGGEGVASFTMWHARSDWSLELHDGVNFETLAQYGARLDLHEGFEPAPEPIGPPLVVPRQPLLLAVLATHASLELHTSRLLRLVELVLVVQQDRAARRLDWGALEALLDRSRASRFVYPALALAERLVPGTIDAGVLARARRATTRRARSLDHRVTATAPILRDTLSLDERLRWADSPAEALRTLLAIVLPPAGASLRDSLHDYHARAIRLASKLSARVLPGRSPAHRDP